MYRIPSSFKFRGNVTAWRVFKALLPGNSPVVSLPIWTHHVCSQTVWQGNIKDQGTTPPPIWTDRTTPAADINPSRPPSPTPKTHTHTQTTKQNTTAWRPSAQTRESAYAQSPLQSGKCAHILDAKSPWRLHNVRWCLLPASPQHGISCMSPPGTRSLMLIRHFWNICATLVVRYRGL